MNAKSVAVVLLIFTSQIFAQVENQKINSLLIKKDYKSVIETLESKNPESLNFTDNFNLGQAYKGLYQYTKSLPYLQKASRLNSSNIEILFALAENFYLLGNSGLAVFTYKDLLDKDPNNFRALIELAKIRIENENYGNAGEIYSKLISNDSTNAFLFSQLAFCKFKVGKVDSAINLYKESLKFNPWDAKNYLQIAKIFFMNEQYDSSFTYVKRGLDINQTNLQLNKLGGEVLFKMKKYRSAINQFKMLIELGDSTYSIYQKLGFSQYFVTQSTIDSTHLDSLLNETINSLSKSFNKYNEDPLTTLYLGLAYKDKDDYQTAVAYFERTLEIIYPDYIADVYTHLGVSFEMEGNLKEAVKSYKKALEFNPEKQNVIFQLASLYDRAYADRSVPLMYFEKFMHNADNPDSNLINYAVKRIEDLKEEVHFRNGKN